MRFAIYGAGGFGREVARLANDDQAMCSGGREVVFVSDFPEPITNGRKLLGIADLTPDDLVVIAIADKDARRAVAWKCEKRGLKFGNISATEHISYDDVNVGVGSIFCAGTVVTSNVEIGKHFHCNLNSYVAHDCKIGDFVTFAPNVCCNGNITIEDDVYIGTGALLKPGITIGRGAVIGMGAVVLKDVPEGVTVVGNPAKPLKTVVDARTW